jgi:poly(A) polymerase
MCPYLEPNRLLKYFFFYFSKWDWNYRNPVMLVPVSHERKIGISESLLYKESENDLMSVLTPAYPAINSSHNVSISTKEAILTEMEKANMIVEALLKRDERTGQKVNPELTWNRLFKKFNFFGAYQHFI